MNGRLVKCLLPVCFVLLVAIDVMASAGEDQTVHPLDPREKAIVTVSAYAAVGDLARLDTALNGGLDAGLTVNEIKELLVQLYAYAGFPRSLNALGAFMTVLEQRQAKGIQDPLGQEPSPFPNDRSSLEFGSDNQTRLVGRPVGGGMYDFAPAIDEFLKAHLFGDIFQRDNLGWRERELATIAILASIDGVNAQLGAHFAIGNYNGLTPAELWAVVDLLGEIMGARCGNNARVVLEGVLNQDN